MPIKPLPASAIRALGSGQVLTDPVSVIKELIDNALDANATTIAVEASANLLDSILVRDNGHGIVSEDRATVCQRHYTSKIRAYEDIATVTSLGFRGEALASAAEMADKMTITTRVEGEVVGAALDIAKDGTIKDEKSVSTPVGTTIKVTGFLKKLPVRRENAIKNSAKNITKLKLLLATYYLSHFRCRFSLRITPGKGSKSAPDAIVYAPSKTVEEAARKVVGKDTASCCKWFSNHNREEPSDDITVEMLLPTAPISNSLYTTHYFFVDSRPISCSRGFLKTVLTTIRARYKQSLEHDASVPTDPFMYLNIHCPPKSYDPNVEPAKDDVMFYDTDMINKAIELGLTDIYGELIPIESERRRATKTTDKEDEEMEIPALQIQVATQSGWTAVNSSPSKRPDSTPGPDHPSSYYRQVEDDTAPQAEKNNTEEQIIDENSSCFKQQSRVTESQGPESSDEEETILPRPHTTTSNNWGSSMDYEIDEDELPPPPSPQPPSSSFLAEMELENENSTTTAPTPLRRDVTIFNPWTAAKAAASTKSSSNIPTPVIHSLKRKPAKNLGSSDFDITSDRAPVSPVRRGGGGWFSRPGGGGGGGGGLSGSSILGSSPTRTPYRPINPRSGATDYSSMTSPQRRRKKRRLEDDPGTNSTLDKFLQRAQVPRETSPWVERLQSQQNQQGAEEDDEDEDVHTASAFANTRFQPQRNTRGQYISPNKSPSSTESAFERAHKSTWPPPPVSKLTRDITSAKAVFRQQEDGGGEEDDLPPPPPYSTQPPPSLDLSTLSSATPSLLAGPMKQPLFLPARGEDADNTLRISQGEQQQKKNKRGTWQHVSEQETNSSHNRHRHNYSYSDSDDVNDGELYSLPPRPPQSSSIPITITTTTAEGSPFDEPAPAPLSPNTALQKRRHTNTLPVAPDAEATYHFTKTIRFPRISTTTATTITTDPVADACRWIASATTPESYHLDTEMPILPDDDDDDYDDDDDNGDDNSGDGVRVARKQERAKAQEERREDALEALRRWWNGLRISSPDDDVSPGGLGGGGGGQEEEGRDNDTLVPQVKSWRRVRPANVDTVATTTTTASAGSGGGRSNRKGGGGGGWTVVEAVY